MADNYFEAFPSDELWPSLRDIRHIILLVGLIEFSLLHLLKDKKMIRTLFWGFQPSINEEDKDSGASVKVHRYDESAMKGGDIDFVLRRLGMFSDCGGKGVCLEELFEEEGPRLEELKEAFEVFDEDGDGFIEAEELQKVLCALGLDEGLRVENCKRMIDVFDEDGDGRIGFDEFVKFMESSLC